MLSSPRCSKMLPWTFPAWPRLSCFPKEAQFLFVAHGIWKLRSRCLVCLLLLSFLWTQVKKCICVCVCVLNYEFIYFNAHLSHLFSSFHHPYIFLFSHTERLPQQNQYMCTCGWRTLMFGRNQHNSVKQLSFN